MSEVLVYSFFFNLHQNVRRHSFSRQTFCSSFVSFVDDLRVLKGECSAEKVDRCGDSGLEVEKLGCWVADFDGESANLAVADGDRGSVCVKWLDTGAGDSEFDSDDCAVVGDGVLVSCGAVLLVGDHDGQLLGGCTIVGAVNIVL